MAAASGRVGFHHHYVRCLRRYMARWVGVTGREFEDIGEKISKQN